MEDHEPTDVYDLDNVALLTNDIEICWGDGTSWIIGWSSDWGAYFAERIVAEDPLDEMDDSEFRTCPGPEGGMFATVAAVEVAMGEALPARIRDHLDSQRRPMDDTVRAVWRDPWLIEVSHLLPDGTLVTNHAPPWADDPLDPKWDGGG